MCVSGIGKTAVVEHSAQVAKKRCVRLQMSENLTEQDLLGRVEVNYDARGYPRFSFVLGGFALAFFTGCWVFLDELNLGASAEASPSLPITSSSSLLLFLIFLLYSMGTRQMQDRTCSLLAIGCSGILIPDGWFTNKGPASA